MSQKLYTAEVPSGFVATLGDISYARAFNIFHNFLSGLKNSEDVTLLLSTLRNQHLYINALPADILEIVEGDKEPGHLSPLIEASRFLGPDAREQERSEDAKRKQLTRCLEAVNRVNTLLAQVKSKRDVWERRNALYEEVGSALKKRTLAEREEISSHLTEVRLPVSHLDQHALLELYEINFTADEILSQHDEAIRICESHLRFVSQMLRSAISVAQFSQRSRAEIGDSSVELMIWEPGLTNTDALLEQSWLQLFEHVAATISALGFQCERNESSLRFRIPSTFLETPLADFSVSSRDSQFPKSRGGSVLEGVVALAYQIVRKELSAAFVPNVAQAPFPPPFMYCVSREHKTPRNGISVRVEMDRLPTASRADQIKVAIALPIRLYEKNSNDRTVPASEHSKCQIEFGRILDTAKANNVDLLIFPELTLPAVLAQRVVEAAAEYGITIVAGLDTQKRDGLSYNEAVVASAWRKMPSQQKHFPSIYEAEQIDWGTSGTQWIYDLGAVGVISVVICSDFLEHSVFSKISLSPTPPDTLIVIARNPQPELYSQIATTDAFRLYCHVVIANLHPSETNKAGGSGFFYPKAKESFKSGTAIVVNESAYETILLCDVCNLKELRDAREIRRPTQGTSYSPKPFSIRT